MPRALNLIALCSALFVIVGCVSNVGRNEVYRPYVNTPLSTRVDAVVVQRDTSRGWLELWFSAPKPYPMLIPASDRRDQEVILTELPRGTSVTLSDIRLYNGIDYLWYQARVKDSEKYGEIGAPLLIEWNTWLEQHPEPVLGLPRRHLKSSPTEAAD